MIGGFTGKILTVDLTLGKLEEEQLPQELYRDFIGGQGLGVRILYERMKPKVDPLGPDNILGFITGLLTGTPVPSSSRYLIATKSPLTGGWGDANSGGYFGHELRAAGYSAVLFSGISPKPVYLWLRDGKAELRDAAHLWGKDTYKTQEILRQELGDKGVRVACIGPSGESLSLMAGVFSDGSFAARCGVGAVMGAKRLKAIAVRGRGRVLVADRERLNALRKDILKNLVESESPFIKGLKSYGTITLNISQTTSGAGPMKNWSLLGAEAFSSYPNLDPEKLIKKYQTKKNTCWGCPIGCKGTFGIEKGPYAMSGRKKTEYETFFSFGPMCVNDDVESIIKAGDICDSYGIDTISAGSTIAFAIECYERDIISKEETDGIELTWGNTKAILAILDKMVRREGFGAVLADGVKRATEQIGRGSEEWAMHIGGQEPAMHDARIWPGRGLAYICDPTPGHHTAGSFPIIAERGLALGPYPDLRLPKTDILDYQAKGTIHATGSSYYQLFNACGFCLLAYFGPCAILPIADCISAVTGWDFTMSEGLKAGRRIQTLRQAFNLREGLHPADFRLPKRMSAPPTTGPFAGRAVDFDTMREQFYEAMGWDSKSGWPLESTLQELGLIELVGSTSEA